MRKRSEELGMTNNQLDQKLEVAIEAKKLAIESKNKFLELRNRCKEEKEQMLSDKDKIDKQIYKENLTKCNHRSLSLENKTNGFKRLAKETEYKIKQCLQGNSLENKEDNDLSSNTSSLEKLLRKI